MNSPRPTLDPSSIPRHSCSGPHLVCHRVLSWIVSICISGSQHERMARGGHGLPKVSVRHVLPNPSTPCGWPPLKRPFQRWPPTGQVACGCLLPLGHPTPYASRSQSHQKLNPEFDFLKSPFESKLLQKENENRKI
jgi:hypothetical protein